MSAAWPLTVYYDASCPLCAREMGALKAHDEAGRLRLVDCSADDFRAPEVEAAGLARAELMRQIHARDAAGRWHRGIEVFVLAYAAVGIEGMAAVWRHPWLRPIWDRLYPWIAAHRMGLSRLGLVRPFGGLVAWMAWRAQRGRRCRDGHCALPPG